MNIKLAGQALIITSTITKKELEDATIFGQQALKVTDENGHEKYRIMAGDEGVIKPFGCTFTGYNRDEQLTCTIMVPQFNNDADRDSCLKQAYGVALAKLAEHEPTIKAQINALQQTVEGAFENIEIL